MMRLPLTWMLSAALGFAGLPAAAQADDSQGTTMIVLDGSGSMWGQIDGTAKIEIARDAIGRMLADWPTGRHLGLMAYGHRSEGDCDDIETLIAPGPMDAAAVEAAMAGVSPRGKTPVGRSVRAAADALGDGGPASVIVVTDGLENCGADLCALGESLAGGNTGLRAHVIGFDIAESTEQLACLAEATGGRYLPASDADSLNDALRQVAEPAPAPDPEPAGPLAVDEFERDALGDAWTVQNPSPQHFILDGGTLVTMTVRSGNIDDADQPNVFRWTGADLPDGDWEIAADFTAEMGEVQTLGGRKAVIEVGRFQDPDTHVVARLYRQGNSNDDMHLQVTSMAGGTDTSDSVEIAGDTRGYDLARILEDFETKGARLVLAKSGREYTARLEMNGWAMTDGGPQVIETQPVQMLRSAGAPALFTGTWGDKQTVVSFRRVEIRGTE
ncbi:vWA domain-containing protein [Roseospira navarrensis]|uniref:VWA domain-containing protein n=1 Tax=Roseospira navarrensis TaxID=140058 RepID=A0A7X1ZDH3_9PROT|nr:VWA domain-containing protein [Roseospira navarrensis]MQX36327.1 VWA domain-containing protein [Roseospira navarrensis]